MATIFEHPDMPPCFLACDGITTASAPAGMPSLRAEYEAGNLLHFPDLRPDIDHDFWASLASDTHPGLKKLSVNVDPAKQDALVARALAGKDVPPATAAGLEVHIGHLLDQIMPVYHAIFAGYAFLRRRSVWRLNTQVNRPLHFDSYDDVFPDHFARMFINLDSQPRIWHVGPSAREIAARRGDGLSTDQLAGSPSDVWHHLRYTALGAEPALDQWPRHTVFFDPGDVWVVDSRQISHQLFYGRRAVSIDFVVARETMIDPGRHYLAIAGSLRDQLLAARGVQSVA